MSLKRTRLTQLRVPRLILCGHGHIVLYPFSLPCPSTNPKLVLRVITKRPGRHGSSPGGGRGGGRGRGRAPAHRLPAAVPAAARLVAAARHGRAEPGRSPACRAAPNSRVTGVRTIKRVHATNFSTTLPREVAAVFDSVTQDG